MNNVHENKRDVQIINKSQIALDLALEDERLNIHFIALSSVNQCPQRQPYSAFSIPFEIEQAKIVF